MQPYAKQWGPGNGICLDTTLFSDFKEKGLASTVHYCRYQWDMEKSFSCLAGIPFVIGRAPSD